jgi:hypothetical protein
MEDFHAAEPHAFSNPMVNRGRIVEGGQANRPARHSLAAEHRARRDAAPAEARRRGGRARGRGAAALAGCQAFPPLLSQCCPVAAVAHAASNPATLLPLLLALRMRIVSSAAWLLRCAVPHRPLAQLQAAAAAQTHHHIMAARIFDSLCTMHGGVAMSCLLRFSLFRLPRRRGAL